MYLLDTHTLLWARLDPDRLTDEHKKILLDQRTKKCISTISIWEISLKFALGKLLLGEHNPVEFLASAKELGFSVIAPSASVIASFYRLKLFSDHKDPFDRMLVWQAMSSDLTVISCDRNMVQYISEGLRLA